MEDCDGTDKPFLSDVDSGDDATSYSGELNAEQDLDNMSELAEEDAQPEPEPGDYSNITWEKWYTSQQRHQGTVREHFLAAFLKHLRNPEGGMLSDEQSLIHVRQVHLVMEALDKDGVDVKCLSWKKGMKIWEDFCAPQRFYFVCCLVVDVDFFYLVLILPLFLPFICCFYFCSLSCYSCSRGMC